MTKTQELYDWLVSQGKPVTTNKIMAAKFISYGVVYTALERLKGAGKIEINKEVKPFIIKVIG